MDVQASFSGTLNDFDVKIRPHRGPPHRESILQKATVTKTDIQYSAVFGHTREVAKLPIGDRALNG
jgi:hypothetical protein